MDDEGRFWEVCGPLLTALIMTATYVFALNKGLTTSDAAATASAVAFGLFVLLVIELIVEQRTTDSGENIAIASHVLAMGFGLIAAVSSATSTAIMAAGIGTVVALWYFSWVILDENISHKGLWAFRAIWTPTGLLIAFYVPEEPAAFVLTVFGGAQLLLTIGSWRGGKRVKC